jgi:hypothetical protein
MNDNDPEMPPMQGGFAICSEDPAIRHFIGLSTEKPDGAGLESLLQSAFEAAWSGGFNRAMD